jgi:hypothetical protein
VGASRADGEVSPARAREADGGRLGALRLDERDPVQVADANVGARGDAHLRAVVVERGVRTELHGRVLTERDDHAARVAHDGLPGDERGRREQVEPGATLRGAVGRVPEEGTVEAVGRQLIAV